MSRALDEPKACRVRPRDARAMKTKESKSCISTEGSITLQKANIVLWEQKNPKTLPLKTCESDVYTAHIQIYSISMTLTFYC